MATPKKKIVLTVEEKLEIIKETQRGVSYTLISEKYGIGRSTVVDIKKNKAKLRAYKHKMTEMGVKKVTTKSMKMGAYDKLDEALYIWLSN